MHALWEDVRNAVLGDGNEAEAFGRQRIAYDFDHLDSGAFRAARALCDHQLAFLGFAKINNLGRIAHTFVDGREPWLAGPVHFDHAHEALGARRKLLHRKGNPACLCLFGARQHTVAAFQGRGTLSAAPFHFAQGQSRRLFRRFG